MRLGQQKYVDAKWCPFIYARYINDCRNNTYYNVEFAKCPDEGIAQVIAIKDIHVGDEIYVDYGKWYWAGCDVKPTKLL